MATIVVAFRSRAGGQRGHADTAASEHRDRLTLPDVARVGGGAVSGHHAAAEQPGGSRVDARVDLRALAGRDQRLLGEGPDAQGRAELGAVGQRHPLRGVVGAEAQMGLALEAGPAVAAHGPPVEDDEVAGRDRGDVGADRLHDPCGLMAEQEREVVVDPPLPVVQVRVAHATCLDLHEGFAGSRIGDQDRLDGDGLLLRSGDDAPDLVCHGPERTRESDARPDGAEPKARRPDDTTPPLLSLLATS